jgi:predicted nucleic acid-binding protein
MVADTSVVLSLLLPDARSLLVENVLRRDEQPVIVGIVALELNGVLARRVRERLLRADAAARIRRAFADSVAEGFWQVVPVSPAHVARATEWLADPSLALHPVDALHVSVAHALGESLFTADHAQARAAKRLGVRVRLA